MSAHSNASTSGSVIKKVRTLGQIRRAFSEDPKKNSAMYYTDQDNKEKDDERRRKLFRSSSHRVLSSQALQNQQRSPRSSSIQRRGMARSGSARFGALMNDPTNSTTSNNSRFQLQRTKSGRVLQYPASPYFEAPGAGMDSDSSSSSSSNSISSTEGKEDVSHVSSVTDNTNEKSIRGDLWQDENDTTAKEASVQSSVNSWDSQATSPSFMGGTFCNPSLYYQNHLHSVTSDNGTINLMELGGSNHQPTIQPKPLATMQEQIKNLQRQAASQLGLPTHHTTDVSTDNTTVTNDAFTSGRYFSKRNAFDTVDQSCNLMDSNNLLLEDQESRLQRRGNRRHQNHRNKSFKLNQDQSKSSPSRHRWFHLFWATANKENQVTKAPATPTIPPQANPSIWGFYAHQHDDNNKSSPANGGTVSPLSSSSSSPGLRRNTIFGFCANILSLSRKRLCLLVLVALGVLAAAMAVHVTIQNKRASSNNISSVEDLVATIDHRDAIVTVLLQHNVTTLQSLNNDQHPSFKALEWLVQQEKDASSSSKDSTVARRHSEWLSQFALATLYHATTSETNSWTNDKHWLTRSHFCNWHGIVCQPPLSASSSSSSSNTASIPHVTRLNLTHNQLQGVLPVELKALTELRVLDLSGNDLQGPILGDWTLAWTKLQSWRCHDNQLTGIFPSSWQTPLLQELVLGNNQIRGTLPSSFGNEAPLMKVLDLQDNLLTGKLPSTMHRWTGMKYLHLHNNSLEGSVPHGISSLAQLEELNLQENDFLGKLPATIGSLTKLKMLRLGNNDFRGPLPEMFTDMVELTDLQLHGNRLRSSLPASIGGLSKLKWLAIDSSGMTGSIPLSWNGLSNLEILLAHDNDLVGSLGATFVGGLPNLLQLSLGTNFLLGAIPSELGLLTKLKGLFLESNDFRGTLPQEMGNLDNLETLKISYNHLGGTMPEAICNLRNKNTLAALEADCNTGIKCDCCTACM